MSGNANNTGAIAARHTSCPPHRQHQNCAAPWHVDAMGHVVWAHS